MQLALACVGKSNGKKNIEPTWVKIWRQLNVEEYKSWQVNASTRKCTKVQESVRKYTKVYESGGQTESQVDAS